MEIVCRSRVAVDTRRKTFPGQPPLSAVRCCKLALTSRRLHAAVLRDWSSEAIPVFFFHSPSLLLLLFLCISLTIGDAHYNLHCAVSCRVVPCRCNILCALFIYKWTSCSGGVMEWLLLAIQSWIYEKSVRNKAISATDVVFNGMGGDGGGEGGGGGGGGNRFSTNWQLIRS